MNIVNSTYSNRNREPSDLRLTLTWVFFVVLGCAVVARLFMLMVLQHGFYEAISTGSREVYSKLFPKRGAIYIQDSRTKEEYPAAINRDMFLLYFDTREIKDDATASTTVNKLAEIFSYDEEKKSKVFVQLNKRTDPYEQIEKKIDEKVMEQLKSLNLSGIGFVRKATRFYPEENLTAGLTGFVGQDDAGSDVGRYGLEGFWQNDLAGNGGFASGSKSATGGWIPTGGLSFKPASDGADILLTIDRTLQYKACERLRQGMVEYKAESASLVIMEPKTGAVLAMCSLPDYNPNNYGQINSADLFNNSAIFKAYEPGSIFKSIVMGFGINEGLVVPNTFFYDSGSRNGLCSKPIKNANDKIYENQTMTGVLENSINTGMVYVAELLGRNRLIKYIQDFGFGVKTGIEIDTEVAGDLSALISKKKSDKIDCYAATASFGQGIMVTPIQMISGFSALINGGHLMKPFLVQEVRHSDGTVEKIKPREIKQVISSRASQLVSGMLVSVVEKGHSMNVRIPGYYLGGKTGTAQIAGPGGYTMETNQSFVGFGPADDPKFAILVKFEKPQRAWADSTAAPVFKDIAEFALKYYQIPPSY